MITIYSCSIRNKIFKENSYFYENYIYRRKSNRKQWRYILNCNKRNGAIAVLIHEKSMLRKYFIQPNLDENGHIKEGEYECRLKNFTIKYKLISVNLAKE